MHFNIQLLPANAHSLVHNMVAVKSPYYHCWFAKCDDNTALKGTWIAGPFLGPAKGGETNRICW